MGRTECERALGLHGNPQLQRLGGVLEKNAHKSVRQVQLDTLKLAVQLNGNTSKRNQRRTGRHTRNRFGIRLEHLPYPVHIVRLQSGADIGVILFFGPFHAAAMIPQTGTADRDIQCPPLPPGGKSETGVAERCPLMDMGEREIVRNFRK